MRARLAGAAALLSALAVSACSTTCTATADKLANLRRGMTAAEATQNAADAVFQGDALGPAVETVEVARRADRLVRQNLAIALLYNLSAVPLAILGEVTPLVAAVAMSTSSLLVIGNALRLGVAPAKENR